MINIINLKSWEDTMELVKILTAAGYVVWIEETKDWARRTTYHVCYQEQSNG